MYAFSSLGFSFLFRATYAYCNTVTLTCIQVLVSKGVYSDVYMFSHRIAASEVQAEFVRITTDSGKDITLTPNHYLYVNGALAVASVVRVGDTLTTAAGEPTTVQSTERVRAAGLYNPHTMDGDIVVDGLRTSTYTSDIAPALAHAALWPVRMLHSLGQDVVGDAFNSGSELIAAVMPDGKPRY